MDTTQHTAAHYANVSHLFASAPASEQFVDVEGARHYAGTCARMIRLLVGKLRRLRAPMRGLGRSGYLTVQHAAEAERMAGEIRTWRHRRSVAQGVARGGGNYNWAQQVLALGKA